MAVSGQFSVAADKLGLWLAPDQPRDLLRSAGGCLAYVLDRLFGDLGLGRVDAPVAASNRMPRSFLAVGGFVVDAHIPQWRELHGELVDYDLFGLTPERWAKARPGAWEALGPWERAGS